MLANGGFFKPTEESIAKGLQTKRDRRLPLNGNRTEEVIKQSSEKRKQTYQEMSPERKNEIAAKCQTTKKEKGFKRPPSTIPIILDGIEYPSISEASKQTGLYWTTIKRKIGLLEKKKCGQKVTPIVYDGVEYPGGAIEASKVLGIPVNTIRGRLRRAA